MTAVTPHRSEVLPWLVAFSKAVSLDVAVTAEYAGPVIAAVLHPSMFLVEGQVVISGETVSSTVIVWPQVLVLAQASVIVHVRVTTIGQVPVATSIYVTLEIPHTSLALPWFVAFSNTLSLEVAVTEEKAGPVMAAVLQPSIVRGTAQPEITGDAVSSTLMVWLQTVLLPHASVIVHVRVTTIGHVPDATSR